MQRHSCHARFLGLVFILTTQIASANTLGSLDSFLIQGESDGWQGRTERGAYWLENPSSEGAIRYFYTPYTQDSGGKRTLRIDVNVANTKANARAGLLYGFNDNPLRYFMLLIGRGGEVEFYQRDNNGVQKIMGSNFEVLPTFNRVEMREDGRTVDLLVNGKKVGSIESTGTGQGSLGIAAMGVGRFGFANYSEQIKKGGFFQP